MGLEARIPSAISGTNSLPRCTKPVLSPCEPTDVSLASRAYSCYSWTEKRSYSRWNRRVSPGWRCYPVRPPSRPSATSRNRHTDLTTPATNPKRAPYTIVSSWVGRGNDESIAQDGGQRSLSFNRFLQEKVSMFRLQQTRCLLYVSPLREQASRPRLHRRKHLKASGSSSTLSFRRGAPSQRTNHETASRKLNPPLLHIDAEPVHIGTRRTHFCSNPLTTAIPFWGKIVGVSPFDRFLSDWRGISFVLLRYFSIDT